MQINNKYLSYLFDTFDTPIRFLYSRAGILSMIFNKLMFWKLYTSNFSKLNERFLFIWKLLDEHQIDLRDKVILELGPGNSFINSFNFLMNGVEKVILVDKYPRFLQTKKQRDFTKQEIDFMRSRHLKQDLFFLDEINGAVNKDYIEFHGVDISELNIPPVDFIYSVSVLEHIRDVENVIYSMKRLLKPGGIMYHHIDIRDHYNFSSPFLFYKYSRSTWENWLTKEGGSYTNRLRYRDFINLFKESGFSLVKLETKRYPLNGKYLDTEFRGQEDLDIGLMDIILKKDIVLP